MNKIILLFLLTLFSTSVAFSQFGGSGAADSGGPGSPKLVVECESSDKRYRVSIRSYWPDYNELRLAFLEDNQIVNIETVEKKVSNNFGGNTHFLGKNYVLEVNYSSPVFEDEKVLYPGFLTIFNFGGIDEVSLYCVLEDNN